MSESLRYGYASRSATPTLHIFREWKPLSDGSRMATWACDRWTSHAHLVDEPNGLLPCRQCAGWPEGVLTEWVYFAVANGLIKIGFSQHPRRRAMEQKALLLGAIPGDGRTEAALHAAFAYFRVGRSEWFTDSDEIRAALYSHPQAVLSDEWERLHKGAVRKMRDAA